MNPEKFARQLRRVHSAAVFLGSRPGHAPEYGEAAVELGRFLAEHDIELIFGGSSTGTMGVLADTVLAHGGRVTGIFPEQLRGELLHPGLTRTIRVRSLAERKELLRSGADVILVLPGGPGTWDELFEALTLRHLKQLRAPIGLLNVNGYFDHLLAFLAHAQACRFASAGAVGALQHARNVPQLFQRLLGNLPPAPAEPV